MAPPPSLHDRQPPALDSAAPPRRAFARQPDRSPRRTRNHRPGLIDLSPELFGPVGLNETAHEGIKQHAGKKNESGVTVGFEKRQAEIRIVDIEPDHLPGQMAGKGDQAQCENKPCACGETSGARAASAGRPLQARAA